MRLGTLVSGALFPLVFVLGLAGCSREEAPGPGPEEPHPRAARIILITVDTLRADRLGAYGSQLGLTPNLDWLAARSERFEVAYAPAPFTLPSVASMMTGRFPEELGILKNSGKLPDLAPTLAGRLQKAHWVTGAVVSNFVLHPWSGLRRGFAKYNAIFDQEEINRGIKERTAESTTDAAIQMLEWAALKRRNFFLWVHYQDPHGPYTPPDTYRARYLERERSAEGGARTLELESRGVGGLPDYQYLEPHRDVGYYRASYDGEVAYLDAQIGRLLAVLEQAGAFQVTAVILVADHGESFGENDYWFAHGEHLNEATLRVPLLIHVPGRTPRVRRDVATLVDLRPTLLALAGLPPGDATSGRDLFAPGAERSASPAYFRTDPPTSEVARKGISNGSYKYLRSGDAERLYRLPDEDTDLSAREPERLSELRVALEAAQARLGPAFPTATPELNLERKRHLEALGYAVDD